MLAILWLIVWATVGDAFYDDYNWYTSDDGANDGRAFDSQKVVRENFSNILRSFANSYIPTRESDDELTMGKVKSRLRMLKVFTHTGNSKDFEPNKGQVLPLHEGAMYCTMGRHTKVDCNHCTCVAGQLYMCTGMICPKPPPKPQSVITCKEGTRRKIDSCNYCYCRNGHEICSTRDCRLHHDHLLIRSQYTCREGARRKANCNRCICRNGEEYCTHKKCRKKKPTEMMLKQNNQIPEGRCNDGQMLKIDCRVCKCNQNRWRCSDKNCGAKKKTEYYRNLRYYEKQCDEGSYRKVDSCNYCLCLNGTEMCTIKSCPENYLVMGQLPCEPGSKKKIDACNKCHCRKGLWFCENKSCGPDIGPQALRMTYSHNDDYNADPPKKCEIGQRYRIDSCNYCYCNSARERVCSNNKCDPEHIDLEYPLNVTETECKIGSRFRKGECNYCYCNYDHRLVCTKNQCTRKLSTGLSDDKELLRFTPAPKICFPHERFRLDSCNWCYCNRLRQRVCERKECDPSQKPDTRWPPNSPRKGCYIGSRFARGKCGYCYCSVYRRIECRIRYNCTDITTTTTPKPIPTKISTRYSTRPRTSLNFECEVGQVQRIDDCNFCRCTFSRKWMCSNNVCPSNYENLSKTKPCTEGMRREINACNYCVCHSGLEFCTNKPCWRDTAPQLFSKPACLVGDPVPAPDPCNLCICLDSDILCTDNPCIQRQSENKKPRCVEGHKYKMDDGCNFCLCQGGQEFCTSRACLIHDNVVSESTNCNEGEVTPVDDRCNMCVCMKGKMICTNKNCSRRKLRDAISESLPSYIRTQKIKKHKMTQGTKQKCNPGKKYFPENFDPNCPNECICDRHELLCTKRRCYNNWDKQTPLKWPLGREEKKTRNSKHLLKQDSCVEYQKLPSDDPCNSCMCLNARKVCTIVTCTDDNQGELGSDEAMFPKNILGSKGNKGNMEKKNNTFCEPFTFFSPDNNRFCRNCFCLHNGLALCLLNLCKYSKDIPHQNSPEELDEVCTPGETGYPTKCVTCTCSEQRKWICTREELALCQERDCDEKDEFHMGFSPYCAGCKCSVKEWFCSIQSETCRDYSNATCPLGTFIHNPRQHCSICLCGGYEEGSPNMCFTEAKCVRQLISHLKQ